MERLVRKKHSLSVFLAGHLTLTANRYLARRFIWRRRIQHIVASRKQSPTKMDDINSPQRCCRWRVTRATQVTRQVASKLLVRPTAMALRGGPRNGSISIINRRIWSLGQTSHGISTQPTTLYWI